VTITPMRPIAHELLPLHDALSWRGMRLPSDSHAEEEGSEGHSELLMRTNKLIMTRCRADSGLGCI